MSVKIMGQVWEKDLPFNKSWVLMAMADHADHDGNNVFPSLDLIAWKTGYSGRQVRRIVGDLRDDGILKPCGYTQGGVVIYRIELNSVPDKPAFQKLPASRPKGVRESGPRTPKTENEKRGCQIVTPFYGLHNRQVITTNKVSSNLESNSYLSIEEPENFDFPKGLFDD